MTYIKFIQAFATFFYDPTLYLMYIIVFVDFLFGVYGSWVNWRIESHLFDDTVDKLTKYTLIYILFKALGLMPLPHAVLPFFSVEIFDPKWIVNLVMFMFMTRECLSVMEHLVRNEKIRNSWPELTYVVGVLGRVLRLSEYRAVQYTVLEEQNANSHQNRTEVD